LVVVEIATIPYGNLSWKIARCVFCNLRALGPRHSLPETALERCNGRVTKLNIFVCTFYTFMPFEGHWVMLVSMLAIRTFKRYTSIIE